MYSSFQTISELNKKLAKGTINQKEYNTEVNKANKNAAIDLSGLDADYLSEASEAFIEKWKNVKIDEYVESAFDKIEKEFIKSWDELDNQLSNGAINEKEYQEAVYQLAQETRKRIGSLGKLSKSEQSLFDFLGTIQNVEAKESDKFNEAKEEFRKKIIENTSKYANSAITLNQYNDAMFELYGSVIDQIAAMDNLTEEQKKYLEKIKEEQKGFVNAQKEKYEKKDDVTPNYKLSKQEIIIRDLEIEIKEKIKIHDDLVDLFNEGATELEEAINEALGNIDSLEDALKLQQVKADIKDLKKQLKQGAWDSFKNLAQSSDRLVSSWQSLKEIMNDEDSTQWEKLITTFNTLIQTIDTLVGLFQMIQNVVEISNKLMQAGAAETVATKAAETTAVAANTAATGVETAAKIALAKANEYVAVTGAAASVASIPIVGAGLAAAAATSTKSLLQSLQAFEKGGIVGGNSFTGDNVLARVNSGEMILNKGQQSTLFSMLNGSAITGGSGKVDFRISGSDLVGTLNNYGKKKSRV